MMTLVTRFRAVPLVTVGWGSAAFGLITAALYLSDALTPTLAAFYHSILGAPIAFAIALIPTILIVAAIVAACRLVLRLPLHWALCIGLAPLMTQSLIIAPMSERAVTGPAHRDGGTLPTFEPSDVVAILDRSEAQSRTTGLCDQSCVNLLETSEINALFLPRTFFDEVGQATGVIYRLSRRTGACDVAVTMARRVDVCLTREPARLSQATHILSRRALSGAARSPQVGFYGGEQITLMSAAHQGPVFQKTMIEGRAYSRWPLLGDPAWSGPRPRTYPRFTTHHIGEPASALRLIDWLALELRTRQQPARDPAGVPRWSGTWADLTRPL